MAEKETVVEEFKKTEQLISKIMESLNSIKKNEANFAEIVTHLKSSFETLDEIKKAFSNTIEVNIKINEEFATKLELFEKQVQELNDTNSNVVALNQKFDSFDKKLYDLEEKFQSIEDVINRYRFIKKK